MLQVLSEYPTRAVFLTPAYERLNDKSLSKMSTSIVNVRDAEFALIAGSWPKNTDSSESNSVDNNIKVAYDTIKGNFKLLLETHREVITSPSDNELVQLCVGISLLHSFVQANWTGPDLDFVPSDFISSSGQSYEELNHDAVVSLAYGGEPAYHLTTHPILLRWSLDIFNRRYEKCVTAPWWRLRAGIIHQYVLDEPAPFPSSIFDDLEPLMEDIRKQGDQDLMGRLSLEQGLLNHHYGNDRLSAQMFVRAAREMGLAYELTGALGKRTKFQQNDLTQLVLLAESRNRDGASPSGESTQLLVVPSVPQTLALNDDTLLEHTQFTSSSHGTTTSTSTTLPLSHLDPADQPALHPLDQCILLSLCLNIRNASPQHGLTAEEMKPYVERCISHPQNWSVHTMSLLLRSRLESSRTRTVERSVLQLQALIDQMPTSDSTIDERLRYIHDIPMPSKWQLEREVAQRYLSLGVTRSALAIFERLEMWEDVVKCYQSLELPDKGLVIVKELIEGQKEEADHVLMKAKKRTVARASLIDKARLAKLYCLLGDLEPQHGREHYMEAWSLSNHTSSRAARSLGMLYFVQGDYEEALKWLRDAARINPLLMRVWFTLGCAAVKLERWGDAREAFSKVVSIDEEDGEGWSNLASVYLKIYDQMDVTEKADNNVSTLGAQAEDDDGLAMEGHKVSPSGYLALAHGALRNGLKYSYDNWRMWNNYMLVSLQIGDTVECIRALGRIADIKAQRSQDNSAVESEIVDLDIVMRLVDLTLQEPPLDATMQASHVRLLTALVESLIPLIPPSTSSAGSIKGRTLYALHILQARLLIHQKQYSAALRAHMDAYRASLGADITPDLLDAAAADAGDEGTKEKTKVFEEAVRCVVECVEALRKLGPETEAETEVVNGTEGSPMSKKVNWSFQTRSILRNFIARMKDAEDDDALVPGWRRIRQIQGGVVE